MAVEQEDSGIYYPIGDAIPIQLVIVPKLSKEHNYWLNNLRNDLKAGSEIKKIIESGSKAEIPSTSKRQTPDQSALHKLAKEAEKNAKNGNPIAYEEAKILDEWAKEYNVPQHHPVEVGSGQHFPGGNHMDHTHIYNIHVPYEYR